MWAFGQEVAEWHRGCVPGAGLEWNEPPHPVVGSVAPDAIGIRVQEIFLLGS